MIQSFWHSVRSYWTPPTVRRGCGRGGGLLSHSPGKYSRSYNMLHVHSLCQTYHSQQEALKQNLALRLTMKNFDKNLLSSALNISYLILHGFASVLHQFILKRDRWTFFLSLSPEPKFLPRLTTCINKNWFSRSEGGGGGGGGRAQGCKLQPQLVYVRDHGFISMSAVCNYSHS